MTAYLCFDCDHRWTSTSSICPKCGGSGQDDPAPHRSEEKQPTAK